MVESAGIDTGEGLPATKNAISVMKEHGIDISTHRTRDIAGLILGAFDRVVAMTPTIAGRLREMGVESHRIVQLEVADPYCEGIEVYRQTAQEIQRQLVQCFAVGRADGHQE